MDDDRDVGRRIAAWRQIKGMSVLQLAKAVGLTAAAIYQWEGTGSHKTEPSQDNLRRVVAALGLTMARFWGALPRSKAS